MKPFLVLVTGALMANMAAGDSNSVAPNAIERPLPSVSIQYRQTDPASRRVAFKKRNGVQYELLGQMYLSTTNVPARISTGKEEVERMNLRIMNDYRLRSESNPDPLAPPPLKPSTVEDILTRPR